MTYREAVEILDKFEEELEFLVQHELYLDKNPGEVEELLEAMRTTAT